MKLSLPTCIAHRGASAHYLENTLLSFKKAKEMGATWIEFDVNVTKDNVAIVFHDDTLERLAGRPYKLASLSWGELKEINLTSSLHTDVASQKIPLLQDVLILIKENNLKANIELKPSQGKEIEVVRQTLWELNHSQIDYYASILFSSFSLQSLVFLKEQCPNCNVGLLFDQWDPYWESYVEKLHPVSLHLNKNLVTPARIQAIKNKGLQILTYTVNVEAEITKLLRNKVDGVFTDHAEFCSKFSSFID